MRIHKQKVMTLFAKPKNRLSQTGKRFKDKLSRALGPSMLRVFGRRGSKQRKVVNIALSALLPTLVVTLAYNNPGARKLATLLLSQAKSSISSLTSETLESSSSTKTLENSNSQPKYIYYVIAVICIVANSIIWQYDENGQIRYRFGKPVPKPEETSELLRIAEKIYDYFPEPISQLLLALTGIGGIFLGGFVFYADLAYNGPISSFLEIIINLFN